MVVIGFHASHEQIPPSALLRAPGSEFRALVDQMRKNERRQRSRTLSSDLSEGVGGSGVPVVL